jgi:hypothetical protein
MAALAPTASVAEDHSLCGAECSLNHSLSAAPEKYIKTTYRIYENEDEDCPRESTGVTLRDGSFLQVFPEKLHFASLTAWRLSYPLFWDTRRELSTAEQNCTIGCGCGPLNWEVGVEPLGPEDAPEYFWEPCGPEEMAMFEKIEMEKEKLRTEAERFGFELVPKSTMTALKDILKTLA